MNPSSSALPYVGRTITATEPSNRAAKAFVFVVVLALVLAFYSLYLRGQVKDLAADNSALVQAKSDLERQLKSSASLRAENDRLQLDLKAEIARKNGLAVENTRLLGRVKQGERDLSDAHDKLKAMQAKPKRK